MAELPPPVPRFDVRGIRLAFTLAPRRPGRPGADLDNLLDPVLSVLVNRLGWFGGSRPGIGFVHATKTHGVSPGCELELLGERTASPILGRRLLDATYAGPLPTSARDQGMADWVSSHRLTTTRSTAARLGVALSFGDARTNLGDAATGRAKPVIDCLWPVIGGVPGAPDDHLVTDLRLGKGGGAVGSVGVMVWERT